MGNCCSSSKRGTNGYDSSTPSEDPNKIIEDSDNHHHHHHLFHHHHNKRHSGNEMKPVYPENKRNSLKSSTGYHHKVVDEDREDLISASVHQKDPYEISVLPIQQHNSNSININNNNSIINNNNNNNNNNNSEHHQSQYPKSYPHTHSRQLSTEKVGSFEPQFKTPITSIPHHMRMEGFQRAKHNSTSSLYIKSTLSTPDNDEILRCMANALLYHIERGLQLPQKTVEIFSEEKYPITKNKVDLKSNPSVDTIYRFIRDIFKAEKLDPECAIMCLAYIERIITFTGITLSAVNWRRITLSALILASKVWEDQSVWNVDFLPVFDNLTAADLNNLERQFLAMLQYNVSLTASVYAKYYFELRNFSKLDSNQFPLKPLDKSGVRRLEDYSKASEYRVKPFKRSASVDQINPPEIHTRLVIN